MTASADRYVRIWDMSTRQELARLAHDLNVYSVSLSPDGTGVLTTAGKVMSLWDVKDIRLAPEEQLVAEACARLFRNFTQEEWARLVGPEPYLKTCPNLDRP